MTCKLNLHVETKNYSRKNRILAGEIQKNKPSEPNFHYVEEAHNSLYRREI